MAASAEGELVDYLQQKFGIGDYDEDASAEPHWKARALEITKLKGMIRRRGTSVESLRIAADYCIAQGVTIKQPFDLLEHIGPARRALREAERPDPRAALHQAAEEAQELGETGWVARLVATDPREAEAVLHQWSLVVNCDHNERCCRRHGTHSTPHIGCILR